MIRFHLDEHVPHAIAEGLRRRGIDVTTTVEAGLRSATDDVHLAYAVEQRRVIVKAQIFPAKPDQGTHGPANLEEDRGGCKCGIGRVTRSAAAC